MSQRRGNPVPDLGGHSLAGVKRVKQHLQWGGLGTHKPRSAGEKEPGECGVQPGGSVSEGSPTQTLISMVRFQGPQVDRVVPSSVQ